MTAIADLSATAPADSAARVPEGFVPYAGERFMRLCGPFYIHTSQPVMGMRIAEDHLNRLGIVHGGLLTTLVDTAMGVAIGRVTGTVSTPTINLNIDFMGAVREGEWVEAHAEVHKLGRRISNASCVVKAGERVVLRSSGTFVMGSRSAERGT